MARTSNDALTIPTNCKMSTPQYGNFNLTVDTLGYGLSIVFRPDGVTRSLKVFYPYVRTSGTWYVNAVFPDHRMWNSFQNWLFGYIVRATDAHQSVLRPITVQVESEDFEKNGYPISTIDYGNSWEKSTYETQIAFASASDAHIYSASGSTYTRATADPIANFFYPGGYQSSSMPRPVPSPLDVGNEDAPYNNNPNRGGGGPNIPIPN